ncbi:MAG: hypothetical protein AB9873_13270 [Syntrophobacteraceae bacterium]
MQIFATIVIIFSHCLDTSLSVHTIDKIGKLIGKNIIGTRIGAKQKNAVSELDLTWFENADVNNKGNIPTVMAIANDILAIIPVDLSIFLS